MFMNIFYYMQIILIYEALKEYLIFQMHEESIISYT